MRPVIAVVPALPLLAFYLIAGASLLFGGALAARARQAWPLIVALVAVFVAWGWTRMDDGITLHSYGLFLVLGFFLSTWLACLEAKRRGYDPNVVLDLAMPLLLVTIIFCRILYFIVYPNQWNGFGEFLQIWNGGLSFHGALIGAPLVIAYFAWSRKIPFGTLCDFVAPGVFLGYAIGRIGCFMNGCCYGHPTDLPWACVFPTEGARSVLTAPSHPAQLYSTFLSLGLFAFIWSVRNRSTFNRFPGQLTLLFFGLYAIERFIIEFFRKGATAPLAFGQEWLTTAQLASVLGLIVIAAIWMFLARRPHPSPLVSQPSKDVPTG